MRYTRLLVQVALLGLVLMSAMAYAGGHANSVKGNFSIVACCPIGVDTPIRYRQYDAWEESDKYPQGGYMYSIDPRDIWYMMDFSDTENTCVNVYDKGRARLGGLVSAGNAGAVGRYFGFDLHDWKQKRFHQDSGQVFRFIGPGGVDDPGPERVANFMHWCETGEWVHEASGEPDPTINAIWPQVVVKGDLKIRQSQTKGD